MKFSYKYIMAMLFSVIFKLISFFLICFAVYKLGQTLLNPEKEIIAAFIESINAFVISLAIFELGIGVGKEYSTENEKGNLYMNVRRTITRFVGTVCIALVLEALIMIIKYSQLEMAGNLFYPVGIVFGGGFLLISMGIFLKLTKGQTE